MEDGMKVQCGKCGTRLNIPDDKLEPGSEFSYNCPKCRHKNTVNVPKIQAVGPSKAAIDEFYEDPDAVGSEFFEEGAKPALVCFNEGPMRDDLVKIMKDNDFVPVIPSSARDALRRLKLTQYYAILLQDEYEDMNLENNVILRVLQPMEMPIRRRMFVALFGQDFKSLDNMTAYSLSVNAVINTGEKENFSKLLERALAETDRFYKVFFDVMRELGKI